ncbi:hypothetical protein ACFQ1E_15910 [Sphingomonas canadensis]|uniref:Uncharacterized protein n=1 Tax=Sphingomonas canadensis TaxID=1219257 RepID=A0ABW3H8T5_9SPHN|nr:hypothetical protein [Sphingomonas canadensis]MCW3837530.1 hypothetical protein [Sphingomonas canadensis]
MILPIILLAMLAPSPAPQDSEAWKKEYNVLVDRRQGYLDKMKAEEGAAKTAATQEEGCAHLKNAIGYTRLAQVDARDGWDLADEHGETFYADVSRRMFSMLVELEKRYLDAHRTFCGGDPKFD